MGDFNETGVERAAFEWFQDLRYRLIFGPDLAPNEPGAERKTFGEVVLAERLRRALKKLSPTLPNEGLEDAFRRITVAHHPSLTANNRAFHRMLIEGIAVVPAERRIHRRRNCPSSGF